MQQKICSQCDIKQPIENYRKRSETVDGYVSECKSCEKKRRDKRKEELRNVVRFY